MTATLRLSHVHSDYQGQSVLKGLNLELEQGEILALLGPSGCGKTTLLRAVAGLQAISQGEISINGQVVSGHQAFVPSEQRGIGMIFQDYALFPHLTVAENILFGVTALSKLQANARLEDMLSLVKLEGLAARYPHELSGGQQQRVSIARALAYEPQLLLLDEPFSNIDAQVRHEMMAEIRGILKQRNVSAVFVTHSKDEAFVFADTLALFNQGVIAQHGKAEHLYSQPNSRYVADFLGSGNYLPAVVINAQHINTPIGTLVSTTPISTAAEQVVACELTDTAQALRPTASENADNLPFDRHSVDDALLDNKRFNDHQFDNSCVQVFLRPQQIGISADDHGIGVVSERRFLGVFCHYWVSVVTASQHYRIEVCSQIMTLAVGQQVALTIEPHALVLFPLDDNERL